MAGASKVRHGDGRRHMTAARREAARRARQRNRIIVAASSVAVVIVAVIVIVAVNIASPGAPATPPASAPTGPALAAIVRDLTSVPAATLNAVGGGPLAVGDIGSPATVGGGYLTPVAGSPLTEGGKPEVLYVGAGFCPYCAAVRWPLIVSLSRFGSFTGLAPDRSAVANGSGQREPYPGTVTWTFHGSSYTSSYLTFNAVELSSSIPDSATGGYTALQALTAGQQAVLDRYDPSGSIPFTDIGNKYVQLSVLAPYGPEDLADMTWSQVTAALRAPTSALGKEIDASANYITAAICKLTGNQPATACTPVIRALQPRLR